MAEAAQTALGLRTARQHEAAEQTTQNHGTEMSAHQRNSQEGHVSGWRCEIIQFAQSLQTGEQEAVLEDNLKDNWATDKPKNEFRQSAKRG
jgi:hypothetical protein